MRKFLFAFMALAACADNGSTGDDNGGGGGGGGGGSGSGSGSGSGGGDVSGADRQADYDGVAASLGANLTASELPAMIDSVNMAFGRMPAGFTVSMGPDYLKLDGVRGGLEIEYKLYCRDDADLLTACSGFENHAHVKPIYSGTVAAMDGVNRTGAWIVRDLTLATPRLGGEGTNAFTSHIDNSDYVLTETDNINHVLFNPTPGNPVGGKLQLTVNVDRNRASSNPAQRTFDVVAEIAFDGSGVALVSLDAEQKYSLDLATGAVVKL